jgi:hypothetical protein
MNEHPGPLPADDPDDLGFSGLPLCLEPWESFYILRRGILPCCHGNPIIAPMTDWAAAWNSPQLQEIRSYLSRGKLSPYCLVSLGCPIVQRHLREKNKDKGGDAVAPPKRSAAVLFINRIFFRIPGKIVRRIHDWKTRKKYS